MEQKHRFTRKHRLHPKDDFYADEKAYMYVGHKMDVVLRAGPMLRDCTMLKTTEEEITLQTGFGEKVTFKWRQLYYAEIVGDSEKNRELENTDVVYMYNIQSTDDGHGLEVKYAIGKNRENPNDRFRFQSSIVIQGDRLQHLLSFIYTNIEAAYEYSAEVQLREMLDPDWTPERWSWIDIDWDEDDD
jgi:hypothetical protein